jgi:hypothetical protein
LAYANFDENQISSVEMKNHDMIKFLSFNKNKLKNLEGFERLSNLEILLLADNEITSLRGLKNMPKLKKLDLSGCQLTKLHSIPELPSLETLIMDRCPISRPKELSNLKKLKTLRSLSLNEVDLGGSDVRKEILHNLLEFFPRLDTINGEKISEEDYEEIKSVKLEKETAAKEAAEAAAEAAKENPDAPVAAEEPKEEAEPEADDAELDSDKDEEGKAKPKRFLNDDQFECIRW